MIPIYDIYIAVIRLKFFTTFQKHAHVQLWADGKRWGIIEFTAKKAYLWRTIWKTIVHIQKHVNFLLFLLMDLGVKFIGTIRISSLISQVMFALKVLHFMSII